MPIDCDAIVVSDLHLGRRGKSRPSACRAFFEELAAGELAWRPRTLILNGDIFENLDLRDWPASHWRALLALREAERAVPTVWVAGNHDGPLSAVEFFAHNRRTVEPVGACVMSGGKRVMVSHGKREAGIGRKRLYRSEVTNAEAIAKLRDQWHGYDRHGLREAVDVARGAIWYARHERFDAAVCGHTHGPFCGTLDGFPYANSGSWTKGNPTTCVVIHGGRLTLAHYEHKGER